MASIPSRSASRSTPAAVKGWRPARGTCRASRGSPPRGRTRSVAPALDHQRRALLVRARHADLVGKRRGARPSAPGPRSRARRCRRLALPWTLPSDCRAAGRGPAARAGCAAPPKCPTRCDRARVEVCLGPRPARRGRARRARAARRDPRSPSPARACAAGSRSRRASGARFGGASAAAWSRGRMRSVCARTPRLDPGLRDPRAEAARSARPRVRQRRRGRRAPREPFCSRTLK